jgi:uncharacterized protein (TIGR03790 family)
MSLKTPTIVILTVLLSAPAQAKKPKAPEVAATPEAGRVLIVVNDTVAARDGTEGMGASEWVGLSYAEKRGIPKRNVLHLDIPGAEDPLAWDGWHIGWAAFDADIRQPLLKKLKDLEKAGTVIQYIVPVWGVPSHLNYVPPAKSGDAGLSVDAQLAAIQSGEARPQRNPYQNAGVHFAQWKNPVGWRMYLVTRLDGPTPAIAVGLVDRAMRAEKSLTPDKGVAYIDARGVACCDGYYTADRSMYRLRDVAGEKRIRVVFDEKEALLQSAPDAMWAWGWYGSPTEAYRFLEGAVGAQLTSYTAGNLRAPYQGNWVEHWLRAGITATWGATSEPNTTGYANGDDLLRAFWSGYNFAESSYLASPALNHMMVFIGDPLYAPIAFRGSNGR